MQEKSVLKSPIALRNGLVEVLRTRARLTPKLRELLQTNPDAFLTSLARQEKEGLVALWEGFTSGRKTGIGKYLMNPKREAIVYLLGFHSPNVMRTINLWDRAKLRVPGPFHIVDLGCGTGALTQGLLLSTDARHLQSVVLVDKNGALLEAAEELCRGMLGEQSKTAVFTSKRTLDQWMQSEAGNKALQSFGEDPVVVHLGYIWNELSRQPESQRNLIKWLLRLQERGPVILLVAEPANQMLARSVMQLRDEITQELGWLVHYPCPHQSHCPMLEKARDWCYSEFAWQRPVWQRNIDRLMNVDRGLLSGAMYIFSSPKAKIFMVPDSVRQNIVVGRPLTRYGKTSGFRHLVCTNAGRLDQGPLLKEGSPVTLRGERIAHQQKPVDDKDSAD